tara:strand:- start:6260 stop:6613 length:354 start_codon:yes stop_codon:yes gene_type:complete
MHNVIPHHHHDDISEINNHEHHHHHDNKEKDHHNENDEPIGLFSHPTHILASTEFIFSSNDNFQKTQNDNQYFLITDIVIKPTTIPIKRNSPNYISVIPLRLSYSTNSLRGPPAFSV